MRIISGIYGRRRFDVPSSFSARPTTDFAKENLFNVINNLTDLEGADALDLFAGTGSISFELLSRECKSVTAVEKNNAHASFIAKVAKELKTDSLHLIRGDVFRYLHSAPKQGFDFIFARELTGGLYFGERYTKEIDGVRTAVDTLKYDENEIRRIAIQAFEIAMKRNKKVCSVDKANVLDSSRLWSKVVEEVSKDYPEVTLTNMLVDNCAMQIVRDPKQFDVILTENMFGDILSDEASMVTGSLGMLSSASLGEGTFGMYEPSHGSAPDIAGQNKANPIATILSAAMLLRYSFGLSKEADAVENAVKTVLKKGMRTIDIMDEGKTLLGTKEMGDAIAAEIE